MACGLPVIVSDMVGSHVDLVQKGKTGFVFVAKAPDSLADCLAQLTQDRALCKCMGRHAHTLVQDWGYDAVEVSLLNTLQKVTEKNRGAGT